MVIRTLLRYVFSTVGYLFMIGSVIMGIMEKGGFNPFNSNGASNIIVFLIGLWLTRRLKKK